jgi:hypothetical protein
MAHKHQFTCVNATVFREVAANTEPSTTHIAAERLLPRVNALVLDQIVLADERLCTDTAHKPPFTCVNATV